MTTLLAPISLSQVVMSPVTVRLAASTIVVVVKEPDLIAFSFFTSKVLGANCKGPFVFSSFRETLFVKSVSTTMFE